MSWNQKVLGLEPGCVLIQKACHTLRLSAIAKKEDNQFIGPHVTEVLGASTRPRPSCWEPARHAPL